MGSQRSSCLGPAAVEAVPGHLLQDGPWTFPGDGPKGLSPRTVPGKGPGETVPGTVLGRGAFPGTVPRTLPGMVRGSAPGDGPR